MFGHQQPQADHVVADFVGQQLPHAPFDAERVTVDRSGHVTGDLDLDLFRLRRGTALMQFFFACRIVGSHAGHYGC